MRSCQSRIVGVVSMLYLVALPLGAQGAAKPDPERVKAARQVLNASGAVDLMVSAMKANIPAQRNAMPQVPAVFWERFEQRLIADAPQFLDSVAVVYAGAFTLSELQQLAAFYASPLGKRLVAAQPAIVTQTAQIGQRWGARIGAEVGASIEP